MAWRPIIGLVIFCVMLATAYIVADRWSGRSAAFKARLAATERMRANARLFESELQKYRLLPLVLSENSDVLTLLQSNHSRVGQQLNLKLRSLAEHTGVDAIYVLDRNGVTLASSNFDHPMSYVGGNFAFRPYFRQALAGKNSEYFARGALSGRPGLFFARPVADGVGVVVAKIEFDKLEAEWARQPGATLIRDRNGVITAASNRRWVLGATRPIPPNAHEEAERTRQYGAAFPSALPFTLPVPAKAGNGDEEIVELVNNRQYAIASQPLDIADWTLSSLEPLDSALRSERTRGQVIGLVVTLILVVGVGLLARSVERRRLLVASQKMLEEEVKWQTAELRGANERLVMEVAERERTSRRLRLARDELAQANRLGSIGQITAGVAHEINQPVAAIQTFAENAKVFVRISDFAEASKNLDLIIGLTSRIGRITSELRSFARRDPPPIGELRISDAFEGTLLLVGDRVRADNIVLTMPTKASLSVVILADRVRLEQVLINLLQNSLDALTDIEQRRIDLRVETSPTEKEVTITVDDNGPGIPPDLCGTLFEPFVTSKRNGLGLGLGIAQNIARQFGGELYLSKSVLGGAAFSIKLRMP